MSNSEIGPEFYIISGTHTSDNAKFGNGFLSSGQDCRVETPFSSTNPERGTIEFWAGGYDAWGIHSYIIVGTIGDGDGSGRWAFGNHGENDYFNFCSINLPSGVGIYNETKHWALVWDKDGIDGTTDTHQIYLNGELVGNSSVAPCTYTWGFTAMLLGAHPDSGISTFKWHDTIDNLKIYNYAKTSFDLINE